MFVDNLRFQFLDILATFVEVKGNVKSFRIHENTTMFSKVQSYEKILF